MHVFVTGATGWVGSAVTDEHLKAGHQVTGLARNLNKAAVLAAAGAQVVEGTLEDLDVLRQAASSADAVIHTAFIRLQCSHPFGPGLGAHWSRPYRRH